MNFTEWLNQQIKGRAHTHKQFDLELKKEHGLFLPENDVHELDLYLNLAGDLSVAEWRQSGMGMAGVRRKLEETWRSETQARPLSSQPADRSRLVRKISSDIRLQGHDFSGEQFRVVLEGLHNVASADWMPLEVREKAEDLIAVFNDCKSRRRGVGREDLNAMLEVFVIYERKKTHQS